MTKDRILVVEDDCSISELICMNLEAAGYEAEAVYDGMEAERRIKVHAHGYAIALVDIMLPGQDGFALLEIMKEAAVPVIYLTARADVASKVRGLKSGAEDYIVKPFEVLELLVRIEKVLERTGRGQGQIEVKNVTIYLPEHKVEQDGRPVRLQPMEYELLLLLARNKNIAFTREQLLEQLWGSNYVGETRTVDVHIGKLRKKLDFSEVIRTIPKTGYRLED